MDLLIQVTHRWILVFVLLKFFALLCETGRATFLLSEELSDLESNEP